MPLPLDKFVKQLEDSGIVAGDTLKEFIPPKASPKDAEELARELVRQKKLTKFQAEEVSKGNGKSLVLGAYTLLDKIGAGGMGQVFKAQHRKMDRIVAVKMLPPAMMKDVAAAARFEREVRAAAKLRHTNIVAADDAAEANGVHFLVMEYVEGKDLSALVKKNGPLPVEQAVNYILQAAKGLEFAHKKGVVHRDIKPANLLLDTEGTVKILDMGLARINASNAEGATQAELTGTGTIMGTVDYMAPEQALNTKHADHRADIYSLGISLYYLLSGKAAYDGETLMEKLLAHREQPIPSLRDVQADVPEPLEAVFKKMVAKKIDDRYQSMTEVVAALEALVSGGLSSTVNDEATVMMFSPEGNKSLVTTGVAKSTTQALPTLAQVAAAEKTKRLSVKIIGGASATVIALILVTFFIKNLEKSDTPPAAPVAHAPTAPAATVPPVVVATNTTTQPNVPVVDDGSAKPLVAPFDTKQAHAGQAAWAKHLGTTVESKNSVGMTLVLIPPGEFLMGSTDEHVAATLKVAEEQQVRQPDQDRIRNSERPQHRVVITRPLLMSATEVTVGQFRKFVEATRYVTEAEQYGFGNSGDKALSDKVKPTDRGLNWKSPGYTVTEESPAAQITWNDACAYCAWLSEQDQRTPWYQEDGKGGWRIAAQASGYRLPTEAEWEYACRAGTTTQYSFGDDSGDLEQFGWYRKNAGGRTQPVALKLPNPFGLFDMHGNLYEWCQDFYDEKWYEKPQPNDPKGPSSGPGRVNRGGFWSLGASYCRSAFRSFNPSSYRLSIYGFRCVRVADASADSQIATNTTSQPTTPVTPATTQPNQPWNTPAFQAWMKVTQALLAEMQVEAVAKKLVELNPGFDGKVSNWGLNGSPEIKDGVVWQLGFSVNHITDISPVRALPGLTWLRMTSHDGVGVLRDLSPLSGMRLSHLNLAGTQVSNLAPIDGMPLAYLECQITQVSDLTPLKRSPLTTLAIYRTPVSELSPLAGMRLTALNCAQTNISDLTPLEDCKTLKILNVNGTKVTPAAVVALQKALPSCKIEWDDPAKAATTQPDKPWNTPAFQQWMKDVAAMPAEKQIEAVSQKLKELNPGFDGKLTGMEGQGSPRIENGVVIELGVVSDNVVDISPVRAIAELQKLDCSATPDIGCKFSDLGPLKGLKLKHLACKNNRVSDLTPLSGMPLESVDFYFTLVSDLTPLARSPLKRCSVTATLVADLTPLTGMSLSTFYCSYSQVSDLSPLKGQPIELLQCDNCNVTDLAPLQGMPLKILLFPDTKVSDLTPLKGMKITWLVLSNTPVADLSVLEGMPLTYLKIPGTKVADLSPIKDISVKEIYLDFKPERDTEILRSIKTLETVNGKPAAEFWKDVEEQQKGKKP